MTRRGIDLLDELAEVAAAPFIAVFILHTYTLSAYVDPVVPAIL